MRRFIRRIALAPIALTIASTLSAQAPKNSVALEADILAYGISGYSGIVNFSHHSGLQVAGGMGRYEVPSFLLKGDENYEAAQWKATVSSIQVVRATYRFHGPMKNGPALGLVVLNQNFQLRSEPLSGETKFRQLSVGITGGYYLHVGKHFYFYPTAAFTKNSVPSGNTTVHGTSYKVEKFGPNASLHVGWAF